MSTEARVSRVSQTTAWKLTLVATAVAALLAGCGQKGALYLPPKPGAVVTSGPAPPAAPPAPSQPPQTAPVQPLQNAPLEPPPESPAPPKKSDPDSDSQSPK
jgi:hypothetical protein